MKNNLVRMRAAQESFLLLHPNPGRNSHEVAKEMETERNASLQSAANYGICEQCMATLHKRIGTRAEQLSDLVFDYELEWANILGLDIEEFLDADADKLQAMLKMPEYDILDDFITAEMALESISEKLLNSKAGSNPSDEES
jgi:hypothetical protein